MKKKQLNSEKTRRMQLDRGATLLRQIEGFGTQLKGSAAKHVDAAAKALKKALTEHEKSE